MVHWSYCSTVLRGQGASIITTWYVKQPEPHTHLTFHFTVVYALHGSANDDEFLVCASSLAVFIR